MKTEHLDATKTLPLPDSNKKRTPNKRRQPSDEQLRRARKCRLQLMWLNFDIENIAGALLDAGGKLPAVQRVIVNRCLAGVQKALENRNADRAEERQL